MLRLSGGDPKGLEAKIVQETNLVPDFQGKEQEKAKNSNNVINSDTYSSNLKQKQLQTNPATSSGVNLRNLTLTF